VGVGNSGPVGGFGNSISCGVGTPGPAGLQGSAFRLTRTVVARPVVAPGSATTGASSRTVSGTHVGPRDAQTTVAQWCDTWLAGYAGRRPNTVRSARVGIRHIVDEFGDLPLSALRPSQIRAWTVKLAACGYADSYVSLLHGQLAQILSDAVHDGLSGRNPCSRRTSPPPGKQKLYVASTEQVWALHDAMPEHLRVAVLLGAFAGLRLGEATGLRVADVDFTRGVVHPVQQWDGAPLKTDGSSQPIPIPRDLALLLAASVQKYGTDMMVTNGYGQPCRPRALVHAIATVRGGVDGLPDGFSFHDYADLCVMPTFGERCCRPG
jgi:integrase